MYWISDLPIAPQHVAAVVVRGASYVFEFIPNPLYTSETCLVAIYKFGV